MGPELQVGSAATEGLCHPTSSHGQGGRQSHGCHGVGLHRVELGVPLPHWDALHCRGHPRYTWGATAGMSLCPGQELARGLLSGQPTQTPILRTGRVQAGAAAPAGARCHPGGVYGRGVGAGMRQGPRGGMLREAAGCSPALAPGRRDELMAVLLPAAMRSGPRHGPTAPAGAPSTGQRETEARGSSPAPCSAPAPCPVHQLCPPQPSWPWAPLPRGCTGHWPLQPTQRLPGLGGEQSCQLWGGLSPGALCFQPSSLVGSQPRPAPRVHVPRSSPSTRDPRPAPQPRPHPDLGSQEETCTGWAAWKRHRVCQELTKILSALFQPQNQGADAAGGQHTTGMQAEEMDGTRHGAVGTLTNGHAQGRTRSTASPAPAQPGPPARVPQLLLEEALPEPGERRDRARGHPRGPLVVAAFT